MNQRTRLFAELTWDNYRNDGDLPEQREVKDLDEAIKYGTQKGAAFFRTYEVTVLEQNGRKFTGEPENYSPNHYLSVSKLFTPAEVIKKCDDARSPELAALFKKIGMSGQLGQALAQPNPLVEQCKKDAPSERYLQLPYGRMVKLQPGDMAYDASGQKIWPPAAQPPAPAANGTPKPVLPKPSGRFKLK